MTHRFKCGATKPQGRSLMGRTLSEKVWDAHVVRHADGEPDLLYIDLHLVHEVTSPQAFDGLRLAGRGVRRPDRTLATADHNVPTDGTPVAARIRDELSRVQVETLERNCAEFGIPIYSLGSGRQGIVHVIAPDDTTFAWMEGRPGAPDDLDEAVAGWRELPSDAGAPFGREVTVDASALSPMVTWGTNPGMVVPVTGAVPAPDQFDSPADR